MKIPFFRSKPFQDLQNGKLPEVPEGADLDAHPGVSDKTVRRIENVAEKVITHTVARKWQKLPLAGQVKVARGMLKVLGLGTFRARFLKSFPEDLADIRRKGATDAEILDYYFSCPEFVAFWTDIGLERVHFETMLIELA